MMYAYGVFNVVTVLIDKHISFVIQAMLYFSHFMGCSLLLLLAAFHHYLDEPQKEVTTSFFIIVWQFVFRRIDTHLFLF